jgi:hypothetical protein
MRRSLSLSLLLLACCLAAPPAASARLLVGLGDQDPATFSDPAFGALQLKTTRLTLAWDWWRDPTVVESTDRWIAAALAARVRPLIAFNRNWRWNGYKVLPSRRLYLEGFRAFRARYPDVRDFSAWNEANHVTQPTALNPKAAAGYYNALRAACRTCTIVAADVLDSRDMSWWITTFQRYAPRARLWGLHNYTDANDAAGTTRELLGLVPGQVWLTETGGIKSFRPASVPATGVRRQTFRQQAAAVRRAMRIARSSRRIERVYFYEWRHDPANRWDSAFRNTDGTPRPAYTALHEILRGR